MYIHMNVIVYVCLYHTRLYISTCIGLSGCQGVGHYKAIKPPVLPSARYASNLEKSLHMILLSEVLP